MNVEALVASTNSLLEALDKEAETDREFNRHPTGESTHRLIEARKRVNELGRAYLQSSPVTTEFL
jgi:hypothetical protein